MVKMLKKHLAAKAERPAVLPTLPVGAGDGAAEPERSTLSRRGLPAYGVPQPPQSVQSSSDTPPTLQQLSQWTLVKLKEVRMA